MHMPLSSSSGRTISRVALQRLPLVLVLLSLAFINGCPGAGAVNDIVSGKVTLNDKPVSGEVIFTGPNNVSASGPALEGSYSVFNPPKGKCVITIKSMGMAGAPATLPSGKDIPVVKDMPKPGLGTGGVPPPAKYERPDNGLTFEVKGGKQEFDIKLQP